MADQVNVWLGMLLTLGLALGGLGAMSLAIGRVVGCLAAVGLLVHLSPEPLRFGFNRREARALLRFGLPLAGTGVIAFAIANVDQLVVGRMLGVTALGFFVLAANLSSWPSAAFSEPISQVAPAALARLQHDPSAMRTSFETMLALVSAVMVPVCLVESGSAAPLIRIVYGVHWLPAHQPLIWLALLAALQSFSSSPWTTSRCWAAPDAHRPADRLDGSPGTEPDCGARLEGVAQALPSPSWP